jgi:hypothetical protein
MKRILRIGAIVAVAALSMAAQEEGTIETRVVRQPGEMMALTQEQGTVESKLVQDLKLRAESMAQLVTVNEGAVMGQPVLGAPYSATEINETTQTLADGTKIHNERETRVYRDGAGRTRREMGNTITIMDPVAKMRYTINTERKTAVAVPMNFIGKTANGGVVTLAAPNFPLSVTTKQGEITTFSSANGESVLRVARRQAPRENTEDLGPQTMEGVVAQGTRTTRTIEAGAIGNDRPINITSERWYSPQLQTVMMTKLNDPRSGETVFRLTGVKLGEPDAGLFQVPAGYQVSERK